jgi:hypothetical protein
LLPVQVPVEVVSLAWTWDTWGGCGVLINNFNGTPANQYAQWVHDHYVTAFP